MVRSTRHQGIARPLGLIEDARELSFGVNEVHALRSGVDVGPGGAEYHVDLRSLRVIRSSTSGDAVDGLARLLEALLHLRLLGSACLLVLLSVGLAHGGYAPLLSLLG